MKYFYEYKEKGRNVKSGGHNLEKISINGNKIILQGTDYVVDYEGDIVPQYWAIDIKANETEYILLKPMEDDE